MPTLSNSFCSSKFDRCEKSSCPDTNRDWLNKAEVGGEGLRSRRRLIERIERQFSIGNRDTVLLLVTENGVKTIVRNGQPKFYYRNMRVDGRMTRHLAGGLPASLFSLDNQPCWPILLDSRIEVQEIFSLALHHPGQPCDRSSIEMRLGRIGG